MEYLGLVTHEGRQTLIEFPDAPGCQTFADRGEDLAALARDALEGWLEAELAHGGVPPRPTAVSALPAGVMVLPVDIAPALAVRLQLRWARQDRELSQGQLARLVGVSRQAIAQWESSDANLRLSTLERVAAALGLRLEVALVGAPEAAPFTVAG
jgi:DNA-binding XRE family transcriptional regulator/predicted RNase H-like HicB family nuclease